MFISIFSKINYEETQENNKKKQSKKCNSYLKMFRK